MKIRNSLKFIPIFFLIIFLTNRCDFFNPDDDQNEQEWIQINSPTVEELFAVSSITGTGKIIAVGDNVVIISDDKGETWCSQIMDGRFYDVCFIDSLTGFLVGSRNKIMRTDDGGQNWQDLEINIDENYQFRSINFINSMKGYIVGRNAILLQTSDGGQTWEQNLDLPIPYHNEFYDISFRNESEGFVVGYAIGNPAYLILKTNDGGANWGKIDLLLDNNPGFIRLTSIAFINDQIGFMSSEPNDYFATIFRTFNGGDEWSPLYPFEENKYTLSSIYCLNESVIYSCGYKSTYGESRKNCIIRSEDSGENWEIMDINLEGELNSIYFEETNTGFAVGTNGIILKSTRNNI